MVLEILALAHTPLRLWGSRGEVNIRSRASIGGHEVGMSGAGYLWGLRTRTRTILEGCRKLIAVGGNRDLMRADAEYLTVSDYEHPEVDIVVVVAAAAEMVVLDRRMRTAAAHFEVDIVALDCEDLSL